MDAGGGEVRGNSLDSDEGLNASDRTAKGEAGVGCHTGGDDGDSDGGGTDKGEAGGGHTVDDDGDGDGVGTTNGEAGGGQAGGGNGDGDCKSGGGGCEGGGEGGSSDVADVWEVGPVESSGMLRSQSAGAEHGA